MTRQLPRLLLQLSLARSGFAPRPARRTRRSAPWSLAFGVLSFALLTFALEAFAETTRPEWRDPEYGHRLRQVRLRQKKRPDQPLVLVFGSSRAQMAVSPAAMGFPDEPGSPLVYNFGYRGAHPLGVWLQFTRALDDGLKPRAMLLMMSAIESKIDGPAEAQFPTWGPRLAADDLRRLAPYTQDPAFYAKELAKARKNPWAARRAALVSEFLPDWHPIITRYDHEGWERMDRYGWAPFPVERLNDAARRILWAPHRAHAAAINACPTGAAADRAIRDLATRCRAEGIALALLWAPESPEYRAMYNDAGRASVTAYSRTLAADLGVPVFPAPDHFEEADFADGVHMVPAAAAKYSKWLADTHLRPWLAACDF